VARLPTPGTPPEDALSKSVLALRRPLYVAAAATLIVLIALALTSAWRRYDDAKEKAADDLRTRAVLAATVFDTYFAGQLQALSAIAASPAVTAADATAMRAYFAHFRPDSGTAFTAGIGWIDRAGRQQAASDPRARAGISLGDRPYFKDVIATRKPVVAEAIVAERTRRRLLVMAVPTRDAGGRLSGVLAGGIVLRPSSSDSRANDLGYAGLNVIDRKGQQIGRRDLARPGNGEVLAQLRKRKEGVLVDATGLDASDGRVIGFATSATPGWTVVLDQPASAVFADARNALVRELLLIGAALMALLMFFAGRSGGRGGESRPTGRKSRAGRG
jgi:hypothetical protein